MVGLADIVTYAHMRSFQKTLSNFTLVDATDLFDDIRAVKSPEEMENLRETSRILKQVFNSLEAHLRPGVLEIDAMAEADDGTAPTIVSIHRHDAPEHTRNPDHFFMVTFSKPVANIDISDFVALGASDEWWRVWHVRRFGLDDGDPFLKPCNKNTSRIYEHLRGDARWDLSARLAAECDRREDFSRQFIVEVGSREIRDGRVRTVRLAMTDGQDLQDVWGNRLDPSLPSGAHYQTFTVDRERPRPLMSADVDTHDGPGAFNTFYISIDFGEPVNGTFSSRFIRVDGGYHNGGWAFRHGPGDRRYRLSIGPSGTDDITVTIPDRAGVEDLAGNPNLAAEPLVIPYHPGALNLTAPPDRTFTAGTPIDVPPLPQAFRPPTDDTYELTGQGGGALPSWLLLSVEN